MNFSMLNSFITNGKVRQFPNNANYIQQSSFFRHFHFSSRTKLRSWFHLFSLILISSDLFSMKLLLILKYSCFQSLILDFPFVINFIGAEKTSFRLAAERDSTQKRSKFCLSVHKLYRAVTHIFP